MYFTSEIFLLFFFHSKAKTVSENLKMNPALLSRFDLIFILLDKPDQQRDQLLSEHVMAIHETNDPKNTSDFSF